MDGKPNAAVQPFFDEVRVEVWVSEPEHALGIREERESPAEGLAEDIYFHALDYIAALGKEIDGRGVGGAGADRAARPCRAGGAAACRRLASSGTRQRDRGVATALSVKPRTEGVRADEVVTGENLPGLLAYLDTFDVVTVRGVGSVVPGAERWRR